MIHYIFESNSLRIIDMLHRSLEAQARLDGKKLFVLDQTAVKLYVATDINIGIVDLIAQQVRSRLFDGETLLLRAPNTVD